MLEGLRGNVCFLHNRGGGLTPQFVLHCDWCGLINGVCETALQNARAVAEARGPAAADAALASGAGGLAVANRYLGFALSMRSEAWAAAVSDEEVEAFCDATFGCGSGSGSAGAGVGVGVGVGGGDSQPQGRSNLLALSRLHILGTMVELVWCPFKRCRDDHYRSDDFRYQRVPSEGGGAGPLRGHGPPPRRGTAYGLRAVCRRRQRRGTRRAPRYCYFDCYFYYSRRSRRGRHERQQRALPLPASARSSLGEGAGT